jgi:hypothetical protein
MNHASDYNSYRQNMRYPSTANSSTSSLGLTEDHNLHELRREVMKLRRCNQELEKHKFFRDVQLDTLQYVSPSSSDSR